MHKKLLALLALSGLSLFAGENLVRNGSFETADMNEFYIRRKINGVHLKGNTPDIYTERSTFKAKDGKFSLLCSSNADVSCIEINLNKLPYTPGKKYRYSMDYFIASGNESHGLSGRVTFYDADKKCIGHRFPTADGTIGKWQKMTASFYAPVNTARITLTYWLSGNMQCYVDNLVWAEDEDIVMDNRNAAACLIADTPDFSFWKQAGYLTVAQTESPAALKKSNEISLSAAANESEPFQLVLYPKKDIPQLHLQFSDLKKDGDSKTVIPASALNYRSVGYIHMKNPGIRSLLGWVADPLLEDQTMDADKGKNRPFFVRVNVPKGQAPGLYKGTATILSGDLELASVKLNVQVRAFELPEIASLKTYFYGRVSPAFRDFDKRPTEVIMDDLHQLYKEHRLNGNQACGNTAPKWEVKDGKVIVTDWTPYDERIKKLMGFGFRNIPAVHFGMMGDNGGWTFNKATKEIVPNCIFSKKKWTETESLDLAGQFANQLVEHNKKYFPEVSFYAYMYDEPAKKVYKDLKTILDGMHQRAPELKIFIPKEVNDNIGYVHTFCVPLGPGHYKPELQEEHKAKGGDIWYYNWYVNLDNHNYIRNRYYAWQIYAADGIGGLLWQTINVHKGVNPWTDMDRIQGTGNATIFYPPHNGMGGLVPSMRAAEVRESIDDFDYMTILAQRIDAKYPGQGRTRVKEILGEIIHVIPFQFTNDPHLLYAIRNRIADEIEAFDKFPATITSVPPENASTEFSDVTFHVFAPAGTKVKMDGIKAVTDKEGHATISTTLNKLGVNTFTFTVGKTTFSRRITLKADPQLDELKKLVPKLDDAKLDSKDITAFLQGVEKKGAYSKKERAKAAKLLDSAKTTLLQTAINNPPDFANALDAAMFQRAKAAFDRKQFEVAEYYLDLVKTATAAGDMKKNKVTINPVTFKGFDGFELNNGIVSATLLEMGGHLVSFKVKGVETLAPGSFAHCLDAYTRAARKVTPDMIATLNGVGGFEDCSGSGVLLMSYVDWNVTFADLGPDKIAVMFETDVQGSPFHIKRVMTLAANSMDLKMDYELSNTLPAGQKSDDPAHHQFEWRGRFLPAIGPDGCLNDQLDVPLAEEDKLAATFFDRSKPIMYERRSVYLLKQQMSAFDETCKTGFDIIGSPATSHAYVWFDTKDPNGVYTLEFPRSFYGKRHDEKHANTPFYIEPGQSQSFTITLRGKNKK